MNKTEIIGRKVFGWKLNRWDRWFDYDKNLFIHTSDFQPEQSLDHAMLIVKEMENHGYIYNTNGVSEVYFNDVSATGETLAQAITNAAHSFIEGRLIVV